MTAPTPSERDAKRLREAVGSLMLKGHQRAAADDGALVILRRDIVAECQKRIQEHMDTLEKERVVYAKMPACREHVELSKQIEILGKAKDSLASIADEKKYALLMR